jgi:hypothetical protein
VHSLLHVNCEAACLRCEELKQLHCVFSAFPGWVVKTVHGSTAKQEVSSAVGGGKGAVLEPARHGLRVEWCFTVICTETTMKSSTVGVAQSEQAGLSSAAHRPQGKYPQASSLFEPTAYPGIFDAGDRVCFA